MPPEFLKRGEFYFKSDVWSFGVLLWEVCSHGECPYKDLTIQKFMGKVNSGERLEKPAKCSYEAYRVMRKCWESGLSVRPSARQLTEEIEALENGEGLFNVGEMVSNL
ncbi:megakaryocyte-associated tyrosine-protein kinase-like [Ptychodera flava]|uniref:megakaryocyte-associated tyrosine-protein kinase-like n=1 Tax=Ptychodera flava TaxID=63121 RepID=UPI00396A8031